MFVAPHVYSEIWGVIHVNHHCSARRWVVFYNYGQSSQRQGVAWTNSRNGGWIEKGWQVYLLNTKNGFLKHNSILEYCCYNNCKISFQIKKLKLLVLPRPPTNWKWIIRKGTINWHVKNNLNCFLRKFCLFA